MSTNGIDYADMFASVQKENTKLREQLAEYKAGEASYREQLLVAEAKLTALSEQEWQPIETAPKDGRILIGRVGHPWVFSAWWDEIYKHWATGSSPMDFFAEPSHWMLPPAAPALQEFTHEPCICVTNIFDNDPETGEKKHCHDCGGTGTVQRANVHHLRIEFEEGYPEDVAFGSEQQMLRLKKWLDKFYAQKERIAELERKLAEQQAVVFRLHTALSDDPLPDRNFFMSELNKLLAQAREEGRKEAVPDGWQVVPKVCTDEMADAWSNWNDALMQSAYEAMLAAAPKHEVKP